ncbi:hypothetical protein DXG01_003630 [Tephrocybe rancida]|nr:hypothetical protein DXG01_003630 [Tephrocybe rancida]
MSPDHAHTASSSWHSIRPWLPPISLSVREITSVSVTFTLSSHLPDLNGDLAPLVALGLIATEEYTDKGLKDDSDNPQAVEPKKKSIISDALAKGLSVDVNGSPWQRVFIRIEDGADEAVIIIYGLMPGREYDVQLGLVHGESNGTMRQQVTTEGQPEVELESSEAPTDPDSPDADHSTTSSDLPVSTPSTSPNRTLPNTPPSTTISLTIEDRLNQLQHALSLVNTERETLANALKSTRRDSQKADAALRSEIETLKRASEKHVAADHRAKQKILSLQEAVKRAQTMTRETEEQADELRELIPGLDRQRQEKEQNYTKVKEQADRARKERERQTEKDTKKLESMKSELAGLTNKMEKLNAKKEKLEGSTITELEEQLQSVDREIHQTEREAQAQLTYAMFMDRSDFMADDLHYPGAETSPAYPYLSAPRMRSQAPGPIGRPGIIQQPIQSAPIQHPSHIDTTYTQQAGLWNHAPRPSHVSPSHAPRSSSLHNQTPILLMNPNRHPPKPTTTSPSNSISTSASLLNHLNSSPTTTTSASTLSSRAPAFEPGRPLKNNLDNPTGASSGFSVSPTPIQRPGPNGSRAPGFGLPLKPRTHSHSQQGPWVNTTRNTT